MLSHAESHPEDHFTETTVRKKKIGVWAALSGTFPYGPYFFEDCLDGSGYRLIFQRFVRDLKANIGQTELDITWFQQDGATPHTANESIDLVKSVFGNRTVGRRLAVNWPPRSPDLTPLDFFLWGNLKERVFKDVKATTVRGLKDRIKSAFDDIRGDTGLFLRVWANLLHRWKLVVEKHGEHIEPLSKTQRKF